MNRELANKKFAGHKQEGNPLKVNLPQTRRRNKRRGQLIVESMIALGVGVMGILGILGLLSRSLSLNRVVADNYQAALLAAEGVEIVKNIIDANQIDTSTVWNDRLNDGAYTIDIYTHKGALSTLLVGATTCGDTSMWPDSWLLKFDSEIGETRGIYSYHRGDSTRFKRCVEVGNITSDHIKVNSIVAWVVRGGGEFTTNVEDHFYNWRQ